MDASGRPALAPLSLSVIGLAITCFIGLVLGSLFGRPADLEAANIVLPVAILLVTAACAVSVVFRDPLAPWTPLPWFLLAMGAYFGVGALLNVFGSSDVIAYAGSYYVVNRTDLYRTNVLNVASIAVVLLSCVAATHVFDRWPLKARVLSAAGQTRVMWIFGIVGVPIKFLLALPYQVGLHHFVLPGIVGGLASCSDLFLLILCYRAVSGNRRALTWAVAFATLSFVGDILSFSKSTILLTGLSVVLGCYLARPIRKTLIAGLLVLAGVYILSVPFVSFARLAVHGGAAGGAGVNERASVTAEYFRGPTSIGRVEDEGDEGWWARINLSNIQAFAMMLHDTGARGDTFASVVYGFVPRLLWPDKPVLSPGADFNYLASGNVQSSSSPGVFAEAYWNGGWPMVVMVCTYIGGLFAWFARSARLAIAAKDLRWLPAASFGIMMAFPENWFVAAYVLGLVSALGYVFAMRVLVRDVQ